MQNHVIFQFHYAIYIYVHILIDQKSELGRRQTVIVCCHLNEELNHVNPLLDEAIFAPSMNG